MSVFHRKQILNLTNETEGEEDGGPMKTRTQARLEYWGSRRLTRSQGSVDEPPPREEVPHHSLGRRRRGKAESKQPLRKRSKPKKNEEPGLMRDLWLALRWCRDNAGSFRGSVSEPSVLRMDEEERQEALKTALESDIPEDKEPFLFVFQLRDDMHAFLSACVDKQGLQICCMFTETTAC